MSSNTNNEGEIRKRLVDEDLVECMVALPGQLFTNTQIPACIWFLTKDKSNGMVRNEKKRDRRNLYLKDEGLVMGVGAKEEGKEKVIVFGLSGHGMLDLSGYDAYLSGNLEDHELSEEEIRAIDELDRNERIANPDFAPSWD